MEHKVEIQIEVDGVMVTQSFTAVIDTPAEATDFGRGAAILQMAFLTGFGESYHDANGE